ncbi:MAG: methyltransferase [Planctomycetota bacterium]|nr:methyltransferase [Planctomycetota bacterium]
MTQAKWKHVTGLSTSVIVLLGTAEVVMMISPFAGFFYSAFRPALNFIAEHRATAWLDGFFLNHALITTSPILEGQRLVGKYIFAIGMWGFLVGFLQIYGAKVLRRPGVMRWGLYWFVRHPQYLCLIVAGWGLLTIWPRFLLLGLYVTMIFLYVLLARLEESRLEEKYPEDYQAFRKWKGGLLPGSPGEKLYSLTFGRISSRPLGFILCYLFCLSVAFGAAFGVRGYLKASTSWSVLPEQKTVALSVWPRPVFDIKSIMSRVLAVPEVQLRMDADGGPHFVAHILPDDYGMVGMYAVMPGKDSKRTFGEELQRMWRLAGHFLIPRPPGPTGFALMGRPIDSLKVVISNCRKAYNPFMTLEECLDPGVKLQPVIIVKLHATGEDEPTWQVPLRRNRWGDIAMPIF